MAQIAITLASTLVTSLSLTGAGSTVTVSEPTAGVMTILSEVLRGEQGIQGIQGPQGDQGIQGPQGDQGIQGPPAPDVHAAAAKATPDDADEIGVMDSAATWVLKKVTWANIKAAMSAWLNTQAINLAITWNNVATTFTALRVNVTNTASAAGSLLMDLQIGGVSKFNVDKLGAAEATTLVAQSSYSFRSPWGLRNAISYNSLEGRVEFGFAGLDLRFIGGQATFFGNLSINGSLVRGSNYYNTNIQLDLPGPIYKAWGEVGSSTVVALNAHRFTLFTPLAIAGSNIATFDNGGRPLVAIDKAGGIYSYNLNTDASNYERGGVAWASNIAWLKTESAGTGVARPLIVVSGALTVATLPAAATAGSGARSFVTDATATTFLSAVAGGGANKVPVVSDGTNWLVG